MMMISKSRVYAECRVSVDAFEYFREVKCIRLLSLGQQKIETECALAECRAI